MDSIRNLEVYSSYNSQHTILHNDNVESSSNDPYRYSKDFVKVGYSVAEVTEILFFEIYFSDLFIERTRFYSLLACIRVDT